MSGGTRDAARRQPRPPRPPAGHPDEEHWRDRVHVDADLANLALRGEAMHRCTFERCRLTGLQLLEATLTDVRFVDCRIDLATLAAATLTRVSFEGCALREADFGDARLQDVLFAACDLRLTEFGGVRSSRLELRGCEVDGLGGVDGLRGALVSWPDAMGLLGPLVAAAGLVVLDPEE